MITQHNPTIFKIKLLAIAAVVLFVSLASEAKADFTTQQKSIYNTNYKLFMTMDSSLNKIVILYADSEDPVYWTNKNVISNYQTYLDSLVAYQENLDKLWSASVKAYASKKNSATTQTSSVRVNKCKNPEVARKAKSLLKSANSQKASALKNYKKTRTAFSNSKAYRDQVNEMSLEIAELVGGTAVPTTDGYEDDAVYRFGSKDKIDMPRGGSTNAEEVDPEKIGPLSDTLYEYDNVAVDVFEAKFAKRLDTAISQAKQSSRLIANCS